MKTVLSLILGLVIFSSFSSMAKANNEWIPYSVVPSPPVVEVPIMPIVSYSTKDYFVPRPPVLAYDWVPYYTTKTLTVERYGLLCKYRTVIQQPCIEWVYQPVWK